MDYLLGRNRDRDGAELLRGDADQTEALIDASQYAKRYTSGVLSFQEADIPEADRKAAQEFTFDYPASSLQSRCSLQVLHRQDTMLANRWHLERSHFECEWE